MKANKDYEWELTNIVATISRDRQMLHAFLEDILSPFEFTDIATRWQIAKQLDRKTPHRKVARNLHIGIATVARGSRMLANKNGGFNQALKKYGNK